MHLAQGDLGLQASWHRASALLPTSGSGAFLARSKARSMRIRSNSRNSRSSSSRSASGWAGSPSRGLSNPRKHVDVHLPAGQRVQVPLHLALAAGGLGPRHLAHFELGEGGLLGLEDLGEGAHPGVADVHRGDVALAPAFGQGRDQGGLATTLEPDDTCLQCRLPLACSRQVQCSPACSTPWVPRGRRWSGSRVGEVKGFAVG